MINKKLYIVLLCGSFLNLNGMFGGFGDIFNIQSTSEPNNSTTSASPAENSSTSDQSSSDNSPVEVNATVNINHEALEDAIAKGLSTARSQVDNSWNTTIWGGVVLTKEINIFAAQLLDLIPMVNKFRQELEKSKQQQPSDDKGKDEEFDVDKEVNAFTSLSSTDLSNIPSSQSSCSSAPAQKVLRRTVSTSSIVITSHTTKPLPTAEKAKEENPLKEARKVAKELSKATRNLATMFEQTNKGVSTIIENRKALTKCVKTTLKNGLETSQSVAAVAKETIDYGQEKVYESIAVAEETSQRMTAHTAATAVKASFCIASTITGAIITYKGISKFLEEPTSKNACFTAVGIGMMSGPALATPFIFKPHRFKAPTNDVVLAE